MKSKLLFAILFLFTLSASGQPVWHGMMDYINGSRYDDIFFINPNVGWAAGSGGYVIKTTDGGQTWNGQLIITTYIRNIEFIDENVGFVATLENKFYRTVDGGTNWVLQENMPFPETIPQWAICGMDAIGNTVYGCGAFFGPAYLIKSTDAGTTWQFIDMSSYAESLVEVLFVDENIGFASGGSASGGIILKTLDGGVNWTEIYNTQIPGEYVWKLQRLFSNADVMFGSVESVQPLNGKLLKSTDGGANWISREVPDTDIQAVGFITENHGWMGGHHTGFLETFDAGVTWTDTDFGGNLNRIQIFNENLAYCAGHGIYKFSDEALATKEFSKNAEREKLEVTIAPNPIANQLDFTVNFKNTDHIILRLFDANGKLLKELKNERIVTAGKKKYSFPFPYAAGTYYLNLHNDTGAQAEKFLKK